MPKIQQPTMTETQKSDPIWAEVLSIAKKEGRSLEFLEFATEGHSRTLAERVKRQDLETIYANQKRMDRFDRLRG